MKNLIYCLVLFLLLFGNKSIFPQRSSDSLIKKWNIEKEQMDELRQAELLQQIGKILKYSYPDSAIAYFEIALQLSQKNNSEVQMAYNLGNIGSAKYIKGAYDLALEDFINALEIWERIDDTKGIALGFNSLGTVYNMLDETQTAINYHLKSIAICKSIPDNYLWATNLFNLGVANETLGNYDSALMYANQSIRMFREFEYQDDVYKATNLLGRIYLSRHEYKKALQTYMGMIYKEDFINQWEICYSLAGISEAYKGLRELDKSISFGLQSLEIAFQINALWDIQLVSRILSESYYEKKDYENAYQYYVMYKKYSDSIFNNLKERKIDYLQLKQKETEYEKLRNEHEVKKQRLVRKNYIIIGSVIALSLLIILTIVLFRMNIMKTRLNKKLKDKNTEIGEKNKKLEALDATKNALLRIISHDLRSPFGIMISFTDEIVENIHNYDRETLRNIMKRLNTGSVEGFRLLENLLDWVRTQTGNMSYSPEETNIPQLVSESLGLLKNHATSKHLDIHTQIPNNLVGYIDPIMTSTIIRNLLSNAIKFTPENGQIEIMAMDKSGHIEFCVRDNGVGMEQHEVDKIIQSKDWLESKPGTGNEQGSGLGLSLCKMLVAKQGGKMWIESEVGKGSSFCFSLPVQKNAEI